MVRWERRGKRPGPPPSRDSGRSGVPPRRRGPLSSGGDSIDLKRLPLPHAVQEVLDRRKNDPVHPGLWITRFVRWPDSVDPRQWNLGNRKRDILKQAAKATTKDEIVRLSRELAARRHAWLNPLRDQGLAVQFQAKTDWRLVIGLAGASPLETSMVFHHLYGVPILPGSSLKGLALAAARFSTDEEKFKQVFGTQKAAGLVDFLDAIPIPQQGKPLVEVDIMNPHYPRWYQKKPGAVPSDDQSPVPVFFLTVAPGTEFDFAILCRTRPDPVREALGQAITWLKGGLKNLGAGAKTAAGYGYFLLD